MEQVLLGRLYERLPLVVTLNLVVAVATAVVFAGIVDPVQLIGWCLLMALVLAARLGSGRRFRAATRTPEQSRRWARRFTLGAGANGLVWGLAGVLFHTPSSVVVQITLPFVLAGAVGGAIATVGRHQAPAIAYVLGAMIPYGLRLAAEGDPSHLTMAALVAVYVLGAIGITRVVSREHVAAVHLAARHEALATASDEQSTQLKAAVDRIHQGIAVFDRERRLVAWNRRHRQLHGYPETLYRRGTLLDAFEHLGRARPPAGTTDRARSAAVVAGAMAANEQLGTDGRVLEIERSPMPGGGFVHTSTDVTERKRAAARMWHLAQHDPLTGLPNRVLFHDRLGQALARARRTGELLAVMLLDVDHFKQINDSWGHRLGDRVLRRVAKRLEASLRASDTVARIGGDEFALILPALPRPEAAAPIAAKILDDLAAPLTLDERAFEIRASVGIALFPADGETGEQLLQNADMAMYRAKALGGGCHPFAATVRRDFERRRSLERDLARALSNGQLSLDYQPQLDLRRDRVTGFEALLRWQHPTLGPIAPETVIAVAEASGQIGAIGEWALDTACRAAVDWPPEGEPALRVAVNLSAMQLTRPDLTHRVARALGASGLPPGRLELEVTETTAFADVAQATLVLCELHDMGVALALDDVGTGYGSLSHLKLFPLDALKIDRSFTAGLGQEPAAAPAAAADEAIVRALIELGHRLGLRVVAEGVETAGQLEALARLGCDEAQGYVVGEPAAAAAVVGWLEQRRARVAPARA